jgi:hypothetical protein
METEGSLPRLQEPASSPFSEQDQSRPCPQSPCLKTFPSTPGSSKWPLSLKFPPPKPCMHLSCRPYMLHALLIQRKLVYLWRGVMASSFRWLHSADVAARRKKRNFLNGKYEKSGECIIPIRFLLRLSDLCYIAISDSASIQFFLLAWY